NNIIKNSFEANAKILKIWTQKKGNYRVINFMDDGVKVSYDKIDKIFNPFFSTKGKTGLGLYLVKKIIEIHEGKIEFIQKNEKIFKIYLKDG
ncbi:MAG: ATP-binding protein, partial [candidate division WOR-3 bacterium]